MDETGANQHPPSRGLTVAPEVLTSLVARTLDDLRRATDLSIAYLGRVDGSTLLLTDFGGPIAGPLRGARLAVGQGLGGRVVAQSRAFAVHDYVRTPKITHHYDEIIRAESLRTMAAAPVIVGRRPVAVLYAALRTAQAENGRLLDAVCREARALEQQLAVAEADEGRAWQSRAREVYAELRLLASRLPGTDVRSEILRAASQLVSEAPSSDLPIHLTAREHDVLALLATGMGNQDIGDGLGIGLHTVKGHLKALFVKLDAGSRFEAVVNARRLNLLP